MSGGRAPGRHLRRLAGHARDRVDRMPEEVGVVHLRPPAEGPHRLAQLGLHQRVDGDGAPALHPADGELEVLDRLDPRMPHLLEGLIGELRLERQDEARRRLPGRVRDDVELDGVPLRRHGAVLPDADAGTTERLRRRRPRASSSSKTSASPAGVARPRPGRRGGAPRARGAGRPRSSSARRPAGRADRRRGSPPRPPAWTARRRRPADRPPSRRRARRGTRARRARSRRAAPRRRPPSRSAPRSRCRRCRRTRSRSAC